MTVCTPKIELVTKLTVDNKDNKPTERIILHKEEIRCRRLFITD